MESGNQDAGTASWVLERAGWSAIAFAVLGLLRACWRRMTVSQRLALGDAFEAKRDPHRVWMDSSRWMASGTETERRSLLVSGRSAINKV